MTRYTCFTDTISKNDFCNNHLMDCLRTNRYLLFRLNSNENKEDKTPNKSLDMTHPYLEDAKLAVGNPKLIETCSYIKISLAQ